MSSTLSTGARPLDDSTKVRWGRIVAGAVLLELALIIVFVPLISVVGLDRLIPFVVAGCFVFGFACGWWVARKLRGRQVFHATAAGILATALYLGLGVFNPEGGLRAVVDGYGPVTFVLANLLRILGCAAGGYANRARTRAPSV
jgi:hypothetical protein